MELKKTVKEKGTGVLGIFSGIASFLGSYQVCHSACLALISLLSLVGITVAGMPLLFLTQVAIPFWITAFVLFIITLVIQLKKGCMSNNMILFNGGVLVAGIPFAPFQKYSLFLWIIGGSIALLAVVFFVKDKITKMKSRNKAKKED